MVYTCDSKSHAERLKGSSPFSGTMQKERVLIILGPTATGKTSLSIELAKKFNGEIISADSRQVYRGMDLGTGKVTKKEMQEVPHYLLDVASPKKSFSAAQYAKLAEKAVRDIISRGKLPIVCGGTGFYIDALLYGDLFPDVPPNAALRAKLAGKTAGKLFTILKKLDPKRAKTIDTHNPVRLVRAIEIATALGSVPKPKKQLRYETCMLGLDMDDDTLKKRILERIHERMKAGMLKEAERLHREGLSWKRMRELGLEYRNMANLLTGKTPKETFEERLAQDIWHYVKHQRTWFRRNKAAVWLDPTKKRTLGEASALVKKFLA